MAERPNPQWIARVLLASIVVWVSVAVSAQHSALAASTYYVAPTGSDSNPGTTAAPWRTIQKAANTLAAGDTVVVQPGTYGERVLMTRSGSSGLPITFLANGSVSMKGFTIGASYITVRGFYITDTPNTNYDSGFGIYVKGSYNTIEDNYVYYALRGGVTLDAVKGNYGTTTHNVVRNNRFERNGMLGIDCRGADNLIEDNEIWGTIQYHPLWPSPAPNWVDADGIHFHGRGHIIRKNYIHDITFRDPANVDPHIDCFQSFGGSYHEPGSDSVLEQNFCDELEFPPTADATTQGFMISGGASNLVIKNNIILTFRSLNSNDSTGLQILNNTFLSSLSFTQFWPEGIVLQASPNATVENNMFVDVSPRGLPYIEPKDATSLSGLSAGHNLVYMSDGRSAGESPWPNDLWNVDPKFVDPANHDYRLRADSPAIDSGLRLPQVQLDYADATRPAGSGWDLGAFEASSPTGTAEPPTVTATAVPPTVTATATATAALPTVTATAAATAMPPTATQTATATATVAPLTVTPTTTLTAAPPTATQTAMQPTATVTVEPPTATPTGKAPTATPTALPSRPKPSPLQSGRKPPKRNEPVTTKSGDNNGFEIDAGSVYALDDVFAADLKSGSGTSSDYTSSQKDRHVYADFGLGVPSVASVKGFQVRLDGKADSTVGSPRMYVELSWDGGKTWTAAKATATLTTTRATYLLGADTDTWGRTWTGTEANNLQIRITDVASNTSRSFSLDYVAVEATYEVYRSMIVLVTK